MAQVPANVQADLVLEEIMNADNYVPPAVVDLPDQPIPAAPDIVQNPVSISRWFFVFIHCLTFIRTCSARMLLLQGILMKSEILSVHVFFRR